MTVCNLGVSAPPVVLSNRRIISNSSVTNSLRTAVMAVSIALLIGVSRAQNSFPSQRCISCPDDVSKQKAEADAGGAFVGGAALGVLLTLFIQWMVKNGHCCCRPQGNHGQSHHHFQHANPAQQHGGIFIVAQPNPDAQTNNGHQVTG